MNWNDIAPLNQMAATWRDVRLGTCSDATIGTDGCLVTCYAMIARVTPVTMNARMIATNNFARGCLAKTFDVQSIGYPTAPPLSGVTQSYQTVPFPAATLARVQAHLREGNVAIACIDRVPTTNRFDQHWILLVGAFGTPGLEDFVVNDPFEGVQTSFLARYGALSRALVRVVLYGTSIRASWGYADGRQLTAARVEAA